MTQRGSRLLLDNFAVPSFAFERTRSADGTPLVPAVFNWLAPPTASAVTCALFIAMPAFECGAVSNFEEAVALFDLREFDGAEPRAGTFDLSAARGQGPTGSTTFRAAGCWAYSFVDVVGATALTELMVSDVSPNAEAPMTGDAGP